MQHWRQRRLGPDIEQRNDIAADHAVGQVADREPRHQAGTIGITDAVAAYDDTVDIGHRYGIAQVAFDIIVGDDDIIVNEAQ